ncbi:MULTISPECIES: hypothetical protein [unclassified Sphingobacterium]|uniref:hypothetical protein n=1 Tax=unclassified Sphingobacterium TaxID=2609468 RepID=UPI002954272D|nr:hypothetical protein [Sphingobacterium sp. UGAL515B_05]WON94260.1 hypothetical protein OK025_23820 [Sphingobacterium sp. UGAL515B_05]
MAKLLVLFFILIFFISCIFTEEDCRKHKDFYRKYEANIVLEKLPELDFDRYKLYGKEPGVNKDTIQELPARWFGQLNYFWAVGDTIVKKKGEVIIYIHKKVPKFDTTEFTCELTCDRYIINNMPKGYWNDKLRKLGLRP